METAKKNPFTGTILETVFASGGQDAVNLETLTTMFGQETVVGIAAELPKTSDKLEKGFKKRAAIGLTMAGIQTLKEDLGIDLTKVKLEKGKDPMVDKIIEAQDKLIQDGKSSARRKALMIGAGFVAGTVAGVAIKATYDHYWGGASEAVVHE